MLYLAVRAFVVCMDTLHAIATPQGAGAVAGALLRFAVVERAGKRGLGPWHVAGINIAGSFVLGGIASSQTHITQRTKLMFGVGFWCVHAPV